MLECGAYLQDAGDYLVQADGRPDKGKLVEFIRGRVTDRGYDETSDSTLYAWADRASIAWLEWRIKRGG